MSKAKANKAPQKTAGTAGNTVGNPAKADVNGRGLLPGDLGSDGPAAGSVVAADLDLGSEIDAAGEVRPIRVRVNRRAGSPMVERLSPAQREAAARYATAFEVVSAGGVSGGGCFSERVGGGAPKREGRQAEAVEYAIDLRTAEAAIGTWAVRLDARGTVIEVSRLVEMVAVGGLSLPRVLQVVGLKRSAPREKTMRQAIEDALTRLAGTFHLENPTPDGLAVDK